MNGKDDIARRVDELVHRALWARTLCEVEKGLEEEEGMEWDGMEEGKVTEGNV
jgi:hypothetical protein